ncbi:MAG: hypothetical protein WC688_07290 [Parachlamydiales bacterium]|jgi:hypothetical protein
MIIGIAGLHGAGKSFLANIMSTKLKWRVVNKRDAMKKIYKKQPPVDDLTWEEWYRVLYGKVGAFNMMVMILDELIKEKRCFPIILDSVHNTDEWRAIKYAYPESILVGVFSPKRVRSARNEQGDEELDTKRIIYWHENILGELSCLLSEVEWAFSGCDSANLQLRKCYALRDYLNKRK